MSLIALPTFARELQSEELADYYGARPKVKEMEGCLYPVFNTSGDLLYFIDLC